MTIHYKLLHRKGKCNKFAKYHLDCFCLNRIKSSSFITILKRHLQAPKIAIKIHKESESPLMFEIAKCINQS